MSSTWTKTRALVPSIPPEIQTQPETGAALSHEPGWSSVESKDLNVLRRRKGMRLRAERGRGQERSPLEMYLPQGEVYSEAAQSHS